MKFLVDMNLSPGWIELLVKSGFEAVHWSGIGRGSESDAELMRWAPDRSNSGRASKKSGSAVIRSTGRPT